MVAGAWLARQEVLVHRAREIGRQARTVAQRPASTELSAAVAALAATEGENAELRELELALRQLLRERDGAAYSSGPRRDAAEQRLLATALAVVGARPMPGRPWCELAAVEARQQGLTQRASNALRLCSGTIPGDIASLEARWQISLLAWPLLPALLKERFLADLELLARLETYEGQGLIERLAAITARVAPGRADLVQQGLTANPDLAVFFLRAYEVQLGTADAGTDR
jgi:hypothetical protein